LLCYPLIERTPQFGTIALHDTNCALLKRIVPLEANRYVRGLDRPTSAYPRDRTRSIEREGKD